MANTTAQNDSITNGIADKKAVGAGGVTAVPVPPATIASTLVVVSGTPKLVNLTQDTELYVNITTAAALAITMGATSAGTGVPISISQSSALGVITFRVPRGWYVVFTGTVTDYVINALTIA